MVLHNDLQRQCRTTTNAIATLIRDEARLLCKYSLAWPQNAPDRTSFTSFTSCLLVPYILLLHRRKHSGHIHFHATYLTSRLFPTMDTRDIADTAL